MELDDRYKHGELYSADSIHFSDSLKYYTLRRHRAVYGGGGIMPDFFVPLDTTRYTKLHRQLVAKGIIVNANLRYIDVNRKALQEQYQQFDLFNNNFEIPQSVLDGIIEEGKKQKVEAKDDEELKLTIAALKVQLKALVARDLWDMSQYFQIMNETNDVVMKAVELIK